jgi:hypothetical protein
VTNGHLRGYQPVVARLRQNNGKITGPGMLELQRVDGTLRDQHANSNVPGDE